MHDPAPNRPPHEDPAASGRDARTDGDVSAPLPPPLPADAFDALRPEAEGGRPRSVASLGDAGVLGRVRGRVRVFPAEVSTARLVSRLEAERLEHMARAFAEEFLGDVAVARRCSREPISLSPHFDAAVRRVGARLGTGDRIADGCLIERGLRLLAAKGEFSKADSPSMDVAVLWYSVTGRMITCQACGNAADRTHIFTDERLEVPMAETFPGLDLVQAEVMAGSRDFDGELLPHLKPVLAPVSVPPAGPLDTRKYPEDCA